VTGTPPAERADTVIVLAKQPVPGRVKTRLQSRFSPVEAAGLAAAALADTLTVVRSSAARHRMLAWEGDSTDWNTGFTVSAQPAGGLGVRLAAAFAAAWADPAGGERALLVGMDTPQVRRTHLDTDWAGADALLGLSEDGGFWAIGLRRGHPPDVFAGVPMSTARTGSAQLARLMELGLSVKLLPPLRDVDLPADAEAVATRHPDLRFSQVHAQLLATRPQVSDDQMFDRAYAGTDVVSQPTTGSRDPTLRLEVARWSGEADAVDLMVVSRCEAPVLDLGCGPGRMVRALAQSGRPALGVDMSAAAVGLSLARGGPAVRRSVAEALPAEGRWGTVLLMDGNVGIGGDVAWLLSRCRDLVGPGGLIVCEVDPSTERHEVASVVLRSGTLTSPPMRWCRVGTGPLVSAAGRLDLSVAEEWSSSGRMFVTLRAS
jgi:glycosyltransferase A (GT-A) superfamily protein (DUF2064 family)/SAM-dependent methyltransferase